MSDMIQAQSSSRNTDQGVVVVSPSDSVVKCELCNITLRSDLDVARHLYSSSTHRNSKEQHDNTHILNSRQNDKDLPKNIGAVFKNAIKINNIEDIKDLAKKGYFDINGVDDTTADIADKVAKVLLKSIVVFEVSKAHPQYRDLVLESLEPGEDDVEQQTADIGPSQDNQLGLNEEEHVTKQDNSDEDSTPPPTPPLSPAPPNVAAKKIIEPEPPVPEPHNLVPSTSSTAARSTEATSSPSKPVPQANSTHIPKISFWPGVKIKQEPKED